MPVKLLALRLTYLQFKIILKLNNNERVLKTPEQNAVKGNTIKNQISIQKSTVQDMQVYLQTVLPFFYEITKQNSNLIFKSFYSFFKLKNKIIKKVNNRKTTKTPLRLSVLRTNQKAKPSVFFWASILKSCGVPSNWKKQVILQKHTQSVVTQLKFYNFYLNLKNNQTFFKNKVKKFKTYASRLLKFKTIKASETEKLGFFKKNFLSKRKAKKFASKHNKYILQRINIKKQNKTPNLHIMKLNLLRGLSTEKTQSVTKQRKKRQKNKIIRFMKFKAKKTKLYMEFVYRKTNKKQLTWLNSGKSSAISFLELKNGLRLFRSQTHRKAAKPGTGKNRRGFLLKKKKKPTTFVWTTSKNAQAHKMRELVLISKPKTWDDVRSNRLAREAWEAEKARLNPPVLLPLEKLKLIEHPKTWSDRKANKDAKELWEKERQRRHQLKQPKMRELILIDKPKTWEEIRVNRLAREAWEAERKQTEQLVELREELSQVVQKHASIKSIRGSCTDYNDLQKLKLHPKMIDKARRHMYATNCGVVIKKSKKGEEIVVKMPPLLKKMFRSSRSARLGNRLWLTRPFIFNKKLENRIDKAQTSKQNTHYLLRVNAKGNQQTEPKLNFIITASLEKQNIKKNKKLQLLSLIKTQKQNTPTGVFNSVKNLLKAQPQLVKNTLPVKQFLMSAVKSIKSNNPNIPNTPFIGFFNSKIRQSRSFWNKWSRTQLSTLSQLSSRRKKTTKIQLQDLYLIYRRKQKRNPAVLDKFTSFQKKLKVTGKNQTNSTANSTTTVIKNKKNTGRPVTVKQSYKKVTESSDHQKKKISAIKSFTYPTQAVKGAFSLLSLFKINFTYKKTHKLFSVLRAKNAKNSSLFYKKKQNLTLFAIRKLKLGKKPKKPKKFKNKKKTLKKGMLRGLRSFLLIYKSKFKKSRDEDISFYTKKFKRLHRKQWKNTIVKNRPEFFKLKLVRGRSLKRYLKKQAALTHNILGLGGIFLKKKRANYVKKSHIMHYIFKSLQIALDFSVKTQSSLIFNKRPKNRKTVKNLFTANLNTYKLQSPLFYRQIKNRITNSNDSTSTRSHKQYRGLFFNIKLQTYVSYTNSGLQPKQLSIKNNLRFFKVQLKKLTTDTPNSLKKTKKITKNSRNNNIIPFFLQTAVVRDIVNYRKPRITKKRIRAKSRKKQNKKIKLGVKFTVTKINRKSKNIFLQKKNNRTLKNSRYQFLNYFIFYNATAKTKTTGIELFKSKRMQRRFWPLQFNKSHRVVSQKKKRKENFLIGLRNTYLNTVKTNTNTKFMFPKLDTKTIQSNNFTAHNVLSNLRSTWRPKRNNSHDFSRKFIQVLWDAQLYHKHIHQKQTLCNRWKFKKKFWIWHKAASRVSQTWMPYSTRGLPTPTLLLVKLGLALSLKSLKKQMKHFLFRANGSVISNLNKPLAIGDIIQTAPSYKHLINNTQNERKTIIAKLKKIRQVNRVIMQSQWRQRKKKKHNHLSHFKTVHNPCIPSWLQLDLFSSSFSPIKQPNVLLGIKQVSSGRYTLDKLTPWRLKI